MAKEMRSTNTKASSGTLQKEEYAPFTKDALRSISEELYLASKKMPPQDMVFTFPYQEVERVVQKLFSLNSISLKQEIDSDWIEKEIAEKELKSKSYDLLSIAILGISEEAPLYIQIPISTYETFFSLILGGENRALALEDPLFFEQFRSFFLFQVCSAIRSSESLSALAPSVEKIFLTEEKEMIAPQPLFMTKISCSIEEQSLGDIRVYFSAPFFSEWTSLQKEKQSQRRQIAAFRETLRIPVSVELGRTFIDAKELSHMQEGDLFLIEHPFYKPDSDAIRAVLTLLGKPLFKAKMKNGKMKLLEMPIQHEIFYSTGEMVSQPKEPLEKKEEHDEDEDSLDTMKEEEAMMAKYREKNEEEDLSSHDEREFSEEQLFEEQEELENEESEIESTSDKEMIDLPEGSKRCLPPEKVDVASIPHTVIAQLTQIDMTVEELANLRSGSIIDLDVQTTDLISLVVQNRVIAVGKLVMIGDHIGVHIQEVHTTSHE